MCIFNYRQHHLATFLDMAEPGHWPPTPVARALEEIIPQIHREHLPPVGLTRDDLRALAVNPEVSDEAVLWAVMAWGRMRPQHARRLCAGVPRLVPLIAQLRAGKITRKAAYDAFADVTSGPERVQGIGPAYFTKLIFFAHPDHDGYIMDQWTSKSINLLLDGVVRPIILDGDRVSPRNTPETYECYCASVEHLTGQLANHVPNATPEWTELCLFSTGGRYPAPWRAYVREQY